MSSTSYIGNSRYSVADNGIGLFSQGPFHAALGNIRLDLAAAPLPEGHYRVEAEVFVAGNIKVVIPRSARFTVVGTTVVGERRVVDALDEARTFQGRWRRFFSRAVAQWEPPALPPGPVPDVSFELVLNTTLGNVRVVRR